MNKFEQVTSDCPQMSLAGAGLGDSHVSCPGVGLMSWGGGATGSMSHVWGGGAWARGHVQ